MNKEQAIALWVAFAESQKATKEKSTTMVGKGNDFKSIFLLKLIGVCDLHIIENDNYLCADGFRFYIESDEKDYLMSLWENKINISRFDYIINALNGK